MNLYRVEYKNGCLLRRQPYTLAEAGHFISKNGLSMMSFADEVRWEDVNKKDLPKALSNLLEERFLLLIEYER